MSINTWPAAAGINDRSGRNQSSMGVEEQRASGEKDAYFSAV